MFTAIVIGVTFAIALSVGTLLLRAGWKRYQAGCATREEAATIAHCSAGDQREQEQIRLLNLIYSRWPETVRVSLDPADPLAQEIRRTLRNSPMPAETMVRIYRARPNAVQVTLDSRRHKMQVCDATKLGLPVTVTHDSCRRGRDPARREETWGGVSGSQRG